VETTIARDVLLLRRVDKSALLCRFSSKFQVLNTALRALR